MAGSIGIRGLFTPDQSTLPEVNEDRKVRVGMLFYVTSDAILAFFFIGSYIFLRGYNTNQRWLPPSLHSVLGAPFGPLTVVMGAALAGGIAYFIGAWALHRDRYGLFTWMMLLAAALYLFDLAAQVYIIRGQKYITVENGGFASAFILLSGYHVYHMAIATFLGSGLVHRAFRGYYRRGAVARVAGTPNISQAARRNPAAEIPVSGVEAEQVLPVAGLPGHPDEALPISFQHTTGIKCIGYYWYYAAIYAVAIWLLVIIQPAAYR